MKHAIAHLAALCISTAGFSQQMPVIPAKDLEEDLTILVSALKEAHTGMYWYTPQTEFDHMETEMRRRINDSEGQTALEFYNTVAPYVAMTKEDHCDIGLPKETSDFLLQHGRFFPFPVKFLNGKPYLIGTGLPGTMEWGNSELLAVNGKPVSELVATLFGTFAADGNIMSSKYRWLDDIGFARLYARSIDWDPTAFDLLVLRPGADKPEHAMVKTVGLRELADAFNALDLPFYREKRPADLLIEDQYALLTIRTFSSREYKEHNMSFEPFIDSCFRVIRKSGLQNLIIDVRANGGGTEGYEDYLFSYLALKPYNKYRRVETNALTYSFFEYTDYADPEERQEFERLLKKEFKFDEATGKYLRKANIERPEKPKKHPFTGKLFILAGGVTYSGGSEFCSLVRCYRKAVFVGEEVGGGYYGNTSGYSMTLTLPHSKVHVEIPIVRFLLDVTGQPEGTGALPDIPLQPEIMPFLYGIDMELDRTIGLIVDNKL